MTTKEGSNEIINSMTSGAGVLFVCLSFQINSYESSFSSMDLFEKMALKVKILHFELLLLVASPTFSLFKNIKSLSLARVLRFQ